MARRGRRIRNIYQRLGLAPSEVDPGRRGVVLLQIDALSYYAAKSSLGRRFMPFLSKLVHAGGYKMERFNAGLPATTPAFQIGLLYGYNDHVPGFRWIDKGRNLIRVMKGANDARDIEAEAAEHGKGLLWGGACHCSLFGGGAERTSLTLSRFGEADPPSKLSWLSVLIIVFLNLLSIVRVGFASLWEILVEVYEAVRAEYEGRLTRGPWPFLAVRVITNVAFRELATQHAIIDLARSVPAMYVNFAGYDELAHHRGPMSISARLALRGIDRHIRTIFRAASRFSDREYDIYVFSDHGQTPSIPFDHVYGASLRDTLAKALFLGVDDRPEGMTDLEMARFQSLLNLQRDLDQILPQSLVRVTRAAAQRLEKTIPEGPYSRPYRDLADVALMPTSDLCHLYFTSTPKKLTVAEVRHHFGKVVDFLARHPGLWAVIGVGEPDADGVVPCEVFNAKGSARIFPGGRLDVVGQSPFETVELPEGMEARLRRLALLPTSGDLVLIASRAQGKALNFQGELGGHGGPYDEEQAAFIISPPGIDLDVTRISDSRDLYRFFWDRYRKAAP